MFGLGICIRLDSYVEHMLYTRLFSHNTAIPISLKGNKFDMFLNNFTTVFSWGNVNIY